MTKEARERLFGWEHAFDSPLVLWATIGVVVGLILAIGLARWLRASGRISKELYADIFVRWRSWLWLVALMLGPILLGAAWVIGAVLILSLLCYREYARVTGLFREKTISAIIVLGLLMLTFAIVDHWDRLYFALAILTCGSIAIVTFPQDRPQGYIQRGALGVLGYMLFGYSFGYIGYIANDANYRPILVLVLLSVELNDVFAYCVGKAVGGPKLLPTTSPGKTIAGSVGALVLMTALVTGLGLVIFADGPMSRLDRLIILGVLISALGQLGDLILSSIKRDVHVKDTGAVIPGHGGLLDRFDSLVLVPPAVFHYLSLYLGPLGGPAQNILTGGQ
jgi:phosphatidate cytidylyltransferase